MVNLPYDPRDLVWMGDSREALSAFPSDAKRQLGFGLRQVQNGLTPRIAKPLPAFGGGVYELVSSDSGDAFRVVYVIKLKKGIYVLDCFKKKSHRGKSIPKADRKRIEARLKEARRQDAEDSPWR